MALNFQKKAIVAAAIFFAFTLASAPVGAQAIFLPTQSATPTPSPTPVRRLTPTPTKSPKVSPTPARTPKASPSPTRSPRKTPTPTPIPVEPVACPPVIADTRSGLIEYNPKRRTYPYRCYESLADAKSNGFNTPRISREHDFTGWYRLSLTLVRDSCTANPIKQGPVLFLQIKQTESGVFGSFCPTIGDYSGVRTDNGYIVSGIRDFHETPEASICADGEVREHQYLQMNRAVQGAAAYTVNLKLVKSCRSAESGAATCVREYKGVAFLETHKIWPGVSENILEITPNCGAALKTCADCHESLKELPPLQP